MYSCKKKRLSCTTKSIDLATKRGENMTSTSKFSDQGHKKPDQDRCIGLPRPGIIVTKASVYPTKWQDLATKTAVLSYRTPYFANRSICDMNKRMFGKEGSFSY